MEIQFGREISGRDFIGALENAANALGGKYCSNEKWISGRRVFTVLTSTAMEDQEKIQDKSKTAEPVIWFPFSEYISSGLEAQRIKVRFFSTNMMDPQATGCYEKRSFALGNLYINAEMDIRIEGKMTNTAKALRIGLLCVPILGWILSAINSMWCTRGFDDISITKQEVVSGALTGFFDRVREHLESSDKLSSASSSLKQLDSASLP